MNKMWRNLIKIRSFSIFRSTNRLDRFFNYFKDYEGFAFCLFDKKTKKSIYWFIHGVEGISANSPKITEPPRTYARSLSDISLFRLAPLVTRVAIFFPRSN